MAQSAWDKLRCPTLDGYQAELPDDDLVAWTRANASMQYHPCSTCAMGADDTTVTDQEGRVNGVRSLRAVDASILPSESSGNLNAPTIMLAEKLSDGVKSAG